MRKITITIVNTAPAGQTKAFESGSDLPAHEITITYSSCGGPKSTDIMYATKAFYNTLVRLRE